MKSKWLRAVTGALTLGVALGSVAANGQTPPAPPAPAGGATAPGGPPVGAAPRRFTPPPPMRFWTPKKTPYAAYTAPNRLWWKLSDVLAMHKGQKNWSQPIIRNKDIVADWHQIAPGEKTQAVAYSDNRTAIIMWSGEAKVTMEGQEPFIARKGFEINIPYRVPFILETVGNEPALYFEVHAAADMPLYPVETTTTKPKPANGFVYEERLGTGGRGGFDDKNKPYLDYYKDVVEGGGRPGAFIATQHLFVNNIRGRGTETPPPSNLGHFHVGYDEFWFVMEGNVTLQVEGEKVFTASAGDIITAAQGRWHRASFGGPVGQMGTRVAINPYPEGLHAYTVESGARQ